MLGKRTEPEKVDTKNESELTNKLKESKKSKMIVKVINSAPLNITKNDSILNKKKQLEIIVKPEDKKESSEEAASNENYEDSVQSKSDDLKSNEIEYDGEESSEHSSYDEDALEEFKKMLKKQKTE